MIIQFKLKNKATRKRKRNEFWTLPKCNMSMSNNFAKDISKLCLCSNLCHRLREISCPLRHLPSLLKFNSPLSVAFKVFYLNKCCSKKVCMKRKHNQLDNELYIIACCLSKIIFRMDLVKIEKDHTR